LVAATAQMRRLEEKMSMTGRREEMLTQPSWLAAHLDDPEIRVLDCTTYMTPQPVGPSAISSGLADYQLGHIPGAQHVDLVTQMSDPAGAVPYTLPGADQLDTLLSGLGISNEHHVILYGRSSPVTITRVWYVLRTYGHQRVSVLDGGFGRWEAEGLPVTTDIPAYPPTQYRSQLDSSRYADSEDVRAAIQSADTVVINSLGREQFAGTGGASYGRAGRISGSVNVPAAELVDPATHTFRSSEDIKAQFDSAGLLSSQRAITYCGGGIAASAGAFALEMIGHDNWALYDNSLLEWSKRDDLPMERDS
jgi:thiosulfate/3-mercaptopyruvate sulfurtransferase